MSVLAPAMCQHCDESAFNMQAGVQDIQSFEHWREALKKRIAGRQEIHEMIVEDQREDIEVLEQRIEFFDRSNRLAENDLIHCVDFFEEEMPINSEYFRRDEMVQSGEELWGQWKLRRNFEGMNRPVSEERDANSEEGRWEPVRPPTPWEAFIGIRLKVFRLLFRTFMMMHNHLLGPSSSVASTSGLQTAAALSEGAILSHALNQPKEELKTHFTTREGSYKLMTMAEYSRPNRVPMNQEQEDFDCDENYREDLATADRICFNVGRELYVYLYKGIHTAADLSKPIDKRVYKGTYPTCHHFNQETATSTNCSLIIGFSAGQIQLIDPFHKEYQASRLYNEERSKATFSSLIQQWLYVFIQRGIAVPACASSLSNFQTGRAKFVRVYTCKAKTTRNPVYRWQIGEGGINQFAFSGPDAKMLATVGHDGYLRIFNYHQMELLSYMKSYFGGLLTLGWSPDAKLIVTGGEDDLLTVYNVQEKRSIDPYMCTIDGEHELNGIGALDIGSDDEKLAHTPGGMIQNGQDTNVRRPPLQTSSYSRCSFTSFGTINGLAGCSGVCYRIGSVGHDTQLCLWDITEDMLKTSSSGRLDPLCEASPAQSAESTKPKKKRGFHRRGFTLGRLGGSSSDRRRLESPASLTAAAIDEAKLLGTRVCPRMEDVPVIEPLICKKIAHERLTVLEFRKDCLVTACQEGFICTWARPGKVPNTLVKRDVNSPNIMSSPTGFRDGIIPTSWGNVTSAQAH
ncbi:WD domain, G-beta repeat protein [Ostertagia ostertagi]